MVCVCVCITHILYLYIIDLVHTPTTDRRFVSVRVFTRQHVTWHDMHFENEHRVNVRVISRAYLPPSPLKQKVDGQIK